MNKTIGKYLSVYAEPEIKTITKLDKFYDFVIVIPICNESIDCLNSIFKNILNDSILIVFIVNSPESHQKADLWQSNNSLFINQVKEKYKIESSRNSLHNIYKVKPNIHLLLIDKNSAGNQIPERKGVGLARKIGSDIALKLFNLGCIKYPWIYSTDADVTLPVNYFSQVKTLRTESFSAIVTEFEHISEDSDLRKCQFLYDMKLRYYQAGVEYAGIKYNYIPLGSTLIVNVLSYAQVRGFPQKNAGEDFYILNKLNKVNPVYLAENCVVKIQSRYSDRVPFGTGPALTQIKQSDEYLYYNPECFILLKSWFKFLKGCWRNQQLTINEPKQKELINLFKFLSCEQVFISVRPQITSGVLWSKFIHQWFDAFKTLKAVHFFDGIIPRMSIDVLKNNSNFDKLLLANLRGFIKKNDQA